MLRRRRPSLRHKVELDNPELNLNSMMDLFAVLIPALLMMSAVVEVTVLNVAAPSLSTSATPPPPTAKPPLNLTVLVSAAGYTVTGQGAGALGLATPNLKHPPITIGLVQKSVRCGRFRNGWPPPHARNADQPACTNPDEQRTFWLYDSAALSRKMVEVKQAYPEERRITIGGEPDTEYEAIIDVMDATRDVVDSPTAPARPLFDEVILSAGTA